MRALCTLLLSLFVFLCSREACDAFRNNIHSRRLPLTLSLGQQSIDSGSDNIFGAEFQSVNLLQPTSEEDVVEIYTKEDVGSVRYPKSPTDQTRSRAMEGFESARKTFVVDSIFFSFLGLCTCWYVGSLKDSYSYTIGSVLGLVYAWLLTRYVETLNKPSGGVGGGGSGGGGSARFAPVILLVLLYGKNKELIAIIPELLGFFVSYQLASFIQIFNEDLYNEKNGKEEQ